eukprot:4053574-Pyramimonas_sp.AAC.1
MHVDNSWKYVRGPTGAFARSSLTPGRKRPSAFNVRTHGEVLDPRDAVPALVKWTALKGYETHGWLQWPQRPDVMPAIPGPSHKDPSGAWLAPIAGTQHLGPKAKRWMLDPAARAALRTAVHGRRF